MIIFVYMRVINNKLNQSINKHNPHGHQITIQWPTYIAIKTKTSPCIKKTTDFC